MGNIPLLSNTNQGNDKNNEKNTNPGEYQLRLVVVGWVIRDAFQELLRKVDPNAEANNVDLQKLDTTALVEQLRKSDLSALNAKANIKHCINNKNSRDGQVNHKGCCKDCDGSSKEHGKDKERTCKQCKTTWINCRENQYVCCEKDVDYCEHCLNCVIENTKSMCWRDLFAKLKQCDDPFKKLDHDNSSNLQKIEDICPTQKLRMCLITMKMVRNLTMHLTLKKCKEIRESQYLEDEFLISWKEIKDTASYALKYVLNYLKQEGCITDENVNTKMTSVHNALTSDSIIPLSLSEKQLNDLMTNDQELQQCSNKDTLMSQVREEFKRIHIKHIKRELAITLRVTFRSTRKSFHLDCPEAQKMKDELKRCVSEISKNGDTYSVELIQFKPTLEAKQAELKVKITSEKESLDKYKGARYEDSERLYEEIQTMISQKLNGERIILKEWYTI